MRVYCIFYGVVRSAGVGRTGTFIALDILLNTARHQQQIEIVQCVEKLRNQRLLMVQTKVTPLYVVNV